MWSKTWWVPLLHVSFNQLLTWNGNPLESSGRIQNWLVCTWISLHGVNKCKFWNLNYHFMLYGLILDHKDGHKFFIPAMQKRYNCLWHFFAINEVECYFVVLAYQSIVKAPSAFLSPPLPSPIKSTARLSRAIDIGYPIVYWIIGNSECSL